MIEIPSEDFVPVLFSTKLLRELAESDGPIRLAGLNGPDPEGYYMPIFVATYTEPDRRPWWQRVFG